MQDPFKNKAFVAAYSHQAHKRFLTPENVDQLVTHLTYIQIQRKQKLAKPSRKVSGPPFNLTKVQRKPSTAMFVDNFIQQQALPTFWEHPLASGKRVAWSTTASVRGQVPRLWRHTETSAHYRSPRIPPPRRLGRLESTFSPASGKVPHSSSKLGNAQTSSSSRHTAGSYARITRDLARKPVTVGTANSTTKLHSFARKEMIENVQVLAETLPVFEHNHSTVADADRSCSSTFSQQTVTAANDDQSFWHRQTEDYISCDSQGPSLVGCETICSEGSVVTTSDAWELLEEDSVADSLTEQLQTDSDYDDEDSEFLLAEDRLLSDISDDDSDVTDSALTVYSGLTDSSDIYTSDSLVQAFSAEVADFGDMHCVPQHSDTSFIKGVHTPAVGYRLYLPPSDKTGIASVASQGTVTASHLSVSDELGAETHSKTPSPPLTPSLFPGRPPTIYFPLPSEEYEPLPPKQRSLLKWKMSTITPNIVKSILARVGFTYCTKGSTWLGYWGHHMKSEAFRGIREYQKVNHFPGSFQLGRKDQLWRNLSRMQARYGKKEYGFTPQTFILPQDMRLLKRAWEEGGSRKKWIIKPPASARGIGIRVINKWNQIPKKRPVIVQRYLSDPFLINRSKFDLRIYVYVSSYDPLRVYVFRDGLVRFATRKYTHSSRLLSNRFIHLTNYSINKKSSDFIPNSDETQCYGHKWGLIALWEYMRHHLKIDPEPVWTDIRDLVVKTIISCDSQIGSLVKANVRNSWSVHELFGFDIMLDQRLHPWLLEVNVSPSLHSNSRLDMNIKGHMMRDILNMAGLQIPSKDVLMGISSNVRTISLSGEEKLKHSHYTQKHLSCEERHSILDNLTVDDCQVLMISEEEFAKRGGFLRIYPDHTSYCRYSKFFEKERYYNVLVEEWIRKYFKTPAKGIDLLRKYAKQTAGISSVKS